MHRLLLKDNRGYVLVLVGCSLFAFMTFFALVADLGHIFVTKAELQNTADAAALAAVSQIPLGLATATTRAVQFGEQHWVAGSPILVAAADVRFGRYNFTTRQFQFEAVPANFVSVRAKKSAGSPSGALPLFFANLFGKQFSNVEAESRAVLDNHVVGVHGRSRLIPYSVHYSVVDADGDGQFDIGKTVDIYLHKSAPGNFGYLDLDEGSNDVPELRDYIENGYNADFIIPVGGHVPVDGSTGIKGASVQDAFNSILNEIVFLPVHVAVHYQGNNAIFDVVALLAVKIKGVRLTGADTSRYIRAEIVYYTSSVLVTDPAAPENNSLAKPRLLA